MQVDILSLFPGYFASPLNESMLKRAQEKGALTVSLHDIRNYTDDKHQRVDDRPYGGGPGMVMMAEPVVKALRDVKKENSHVVYLSPQGAKLDAKKALELAQKPSLVLLCGHYEGIDERALALVDEQISIGDYVLTNGCLAALVLMDTVIRFLPGVLGDSESAKQDSFQSKLLDCPHFTKPVEFEGVNVPEVLLSGHHKNIERWRQAEKIEKTIDVRPDLWFETTGDEVKDSFIKLFVKNLNVSLKFYQNVVKGTINQIDDRKAIVSIDNYKFYLVQEEVQDLSLNKKILFSRPFTKKQRVIKDPDGYYWSI
ncbi:MAG: tRNA (guanosine(37)-N1)-methyltransferase TrmD [Parachlamydiales bacterium]|nr:tRNA (guanosine(37)-N1)-methyltransferase TrmD [Parachlamydiales bacterium]